MQSTQPAPRTVALAGDWHGSTADAVRVIREAAAAGAEWIMQLGDFGFSCLKPSRYLDELERACAQSGVSLAWLDGNHENHANLSKLHNARRPCPMRPHIWYLPRGCRWSWHGTTWAAVGGATSLDRGRRTRMINWWPEEELSERQAAAISAGPPAEVMLCHDAPACSRPPFPRDVTWPRGELVRAKEHRRRMQSVMDALRPVLVVHGHLHLHYVNRVARPYGSAVVIGLDYATAGRAPHWLLLDTRSLAWSVPQRAPLST